MLSGCFLTGFLGSVCCYLAVAPAFLQQKEVVSLFSTSFRQLKDVMTNLTGFRLKLLLNKLVPDICISFQITNIPTQLPGAQVAVLLLDHQTFSLKTPALLWCPCSMNHLLTFSSLRRPSKRPVLPLETSPPPAWELPPLWPQAPHQVISPTGFW